MVETSLSIRALSTPRVTVIESVEQQDLVMQGFEIST